MAREYRAGHTIKPGHTVNGIAVGVEPEYASRDIAKGMIACAIELARRRGFRKAIAFLSSPISQHILADRFGWRLEQQVRYRDFELDGTRSLACISGVDAMMLRSIDL
jgi:hypothetical protein